MSQMLPYDEIELWHGHPDLYMNWLEEILSTPDDNDIGYFIEVDLKFLIIKKKKQNIFRFVLKIKLSLKKNIMNI